MYYLFIHRINQIPNTFIKLLKDGKPQKRNNGRFHDGIAGIYLIPI